MRKKAYDNNAFSLIISHNKNGKTISQRVEIPIIKTGHYGTPVGGRQTFLMAIDNYTTQFKDEDELLNQIREQGLARISSFKNDELNIKVDYTGKGKFVCDLLPIAYSDQEKVKSFVSSHNLNVCTFTPDDPEVDAFQKRILKGWFDEVHSVEYRKFMTDRRINHYYGYDLTATLEHYRNYITPDYDRNAFIGPTGRYHNLRADFMLDDKQRENILEWIAYNFTSYQERNEVKKPENPNNYVEGLKPLKVPRTPVKIEETPSQLALFDRGDYTNQGPSQKPRNL